MHVIAQYIAVVLAKLCVLDSIQKRSANTANTFCRTLGNSSDGKPKLVTWICRGIKEEFLVFTTRGKFLTETARCASGVGWYAKRRWLRILLTLLFLSLNQTYDYSLTQAVCDIGVNILIHLKTLKQLADASLTGLWELVEVVAGGGFTFF